AGHIQGKLWIRGECPAHSRIVNTIIYDAESRDTHNHGTHLLTSLVLIFHPET
ncbi:short coiled-coil protein B-like X1, partial [Biomphalaria pfeifferi]